MRWVVRCPAKVNLFLAVGPRDERGYHPLRTTFQAVGLSDELTLELGGNQLEITSDWPELPKENTLTKAIRLASELVDMPPMHIHLSKRIPAESGLGGGSSDAAGILRWLQRRSGSSVTAATWAEIALAVGADVPFFMVGGRAQAEGYGERLRAQPDEPKRWLVIARPDVGVSTPRAYAELDQRSFPWLEFPVDGDTWHNDFERVAPCASLELMEQLRHWGALRVVLCGSGSAVCGEFASQEQCVKIADRLREGQTLAWPTETISREESLWIL